MSINLLYILPNEELKRCRFDNPEQIRNDFKYHSKKWRMSYLWVYWGVWGFQIGLLISLLFLIGLVCVFYGIFDIKSVFVLALIYSAILSWKLHLLLTASFLQSAFIVFHFDDQCISSANPSDAQITMKANAYNL